jgi:hypothetical protein
MEEVRLLSGLQGTARASSSFLGPMPPASG